MTSKSTHLAINIPHDSKSSVRRPHTKKVNVTYFIILNEG